MGQYLIQNLDNNTLSGVTLSSAFDGAGAITVGTAKKEKAEILVDYTQATGETANDVEVKLESGPSATEVYHLVNSANDAGNLVSTGGLHILDGMAAGNNKRAIPVDVQNKFLKISLREAGVANTHGTASVKVFLSGR